MILAVENEFGESSGVSDRFPRLRESPKDADSAVQQAAKVAVQWIAPKKWVHKRAGTVRERWPRKLLPDGRGS